MKKKNINVLKSQPTPVFLTKEKKNTDSSSGITETG